VRLPLKGSGTSPASLSDSGVLHFWCAEHAVLEGKNFRKEMRMHASMAYVNGAGDQRRNGTHPKLMDSLALLNTLLAGSVNDKKPKNEKQAEEENKAKPVSKPGGFANDPNDPKNPNEVRERHHQKVRP
jgi:hypothetical protein